MKLKTLQDLFAHELKDLYSAETQLIKALPKMAKAATHEDLQAGLSSISKKPKSTSPAWSRSPRPTTSSSAATSAKPWKA